jgi:hypothetical protein
LQPNVATLQAGCNAALALGAKGPCRYDASVTVPTFDSIVRPRAATAAPNVDARWSGQWYDPARNGEGIALEVLDGGKALVYMFTYPPAGAPGQQAWLIGVGDVLGNGIEFTDVRRSSLGAGGVPQSAHWGRIGLIFDDCNSGHMRWDGPADWGSLEVPITRITALQGLGCANAAAGAPQQASGSWYDARYTGSGFVFEQLDAQRLATIWFGFDASGNQIWLSGVAQNGIDGFAATLAEPVGPHFGAGYDPAAFNPQPVGSLSSAKLNCSTGNAGALGFPGLPDGNATFALDLARITFPLGQAQCQ